MVGPLDVKSKIFSFRPKSIIKLSFIVLPMLLADL